MLVYIPNRNIYLLKTFSLFKYLEPPPPPVNISSGEVKETQISVNWDRPKLFDLFGIKSYMIIYHPFDELLNKTKEIVSIEQNGLLNNLNSNQFYEIYLRGINKYGHGEDSNRIRVKTKKKGINRLDQ